MKSITKTNPFRALKITWCRLSICVKPKIKPDKNISNNRCHWLGFLIKKKKILTGINWKTNVSNNGANKIASIKSSHQFITSGSLGWPSKKREHTVIPKSNKKDFQKLKNDKFILWKSSTQIKTNLNSTNWSSRDDPKFELVNCSENHENTQTT